MGGRVERAPPHALPGLDEHPHARAVLAAALGPEGRPSHAYLFHGPPGSGKRRVAEAFAAALLADGGADRAGVAERVARRTHPDLSWVTPSGAAEMLVSDVDEAVIAAATRTPFESSRRVFVIERAETMNDQAANRMLKTLEEPASFVHLVLLVDRPEDLLATIASRCQRVRFDPPSSERIAAGLRERGARPGDGGGLRAARPRRRPPGGRARRRVRGRAARGGRALRASLARRRRRATDRGRTCSRRRARRASAPARR